MSGEFIERVKALRTRVVVPGCNLTAELTGRSQLRIEFPPGSYPQCTERGLEKCLEATCRLLCAATVTAYRKMIADAPSPPDGDKLYDALARLETDGRASDGRVRVVTRGMRTWRAFVAPGTLEALQEHEFADGVSQAVGQMIERWYSRAHQIMTAL